DADMSNSSSQRSRSLQEGLWPGCQSLLSYNLCERLRRFGGIRMTRSMIVLAAMMAAITAGCENMTPGQKGAVTGAALGSGIGMVAGGSAGQVIGAGLIGGAAGYVAGSVIGDK